MFAKIVCFVTVAALSAGLRKIFFANVSKGLIMLYFSAIVEDIESRAIGGANVAITEVRHMASLRSLNNIHFCGGSILNVRYILTSATCTDGKLDYSINIVVGTVSLTSGGTTYRSDKIYIHPAFDRQTLTNE